tara:strand:- start:223 stop:384 length:162 start_codon:yes stop_codon:yes gene_type:complete
MGETVVPDFSQYFSTNTLIRCIAFSLGISAMGLFLPARWPLIFESPLLDVANG